jgi:glycerate dehydrogenase
MPKIVVLDGNALNPGDISWEPIEKLADSFTLWPRTTPGETEERSRGADILLTNKTVLTKENMEALPELKYIGVLATGYNVVDTKAAKSRGIVVTNVPAYSTMAVAQYAIGLLLELAGHAGLHARAVKGGCWKTAPDFCFWDAPLTELDGKTMGIIGYGAIGRRVSLIAAALGMRVLAYNGNRAPDDPEPGTKMSTLEELLRSSDVISLHAPLNNGTKEIISALTLSLMKDGVIIINTSRGGLVSDNDLAEALKSGKAAWAALDVLSSEPPSPDNPLLALDNCLITPHLAWSPREARLRLMARAAENIEAFLKGSPVNTVAG